METMMHEVTAIEPGRDPDWVVLTIDEDRRIPLPTGDLVKLDLARGDSITPESLERLELASETARARKSALNLLAHRARSRSEIEQRLHRKAYGQASIDGVMEWLNGMGYIDDQAFAEAFVRDRMRLRPRGRRALVAELAQKGIDREMAETVIADLTEAESGLPSFQDAAAAFTEKWVRTRGKRHKDRWARRRALYSALARKGFSSDIIRTVMEEVESD